MKNTLVVVADLACYKAYKLDNNHQHSSPRLELIEQYLTPEAQTKISQKVSDSSGRFSRGATAGPMSDGERHNIELEMRKRLVRQLAGRLNSLAGKDEFERCMVAISKEINHLVMDELEPQVRSKIHRNIAADLTKVERAEVLRHF